MWVTFAVDYEYLKKNWKKIFFDHFYEFFVCIFDIKNTKIVWKKFHLASFVYNPQSNIYKKKLIVRFLNLFLAIICQYICVSAQNSLKICFLWSGDKNEQKSFFRKKVTSWPYDLTWPGPNFFKKNFFAQFYLLITKITFLVHFENIFLTVTLQDIYMYHPATTGPVILCI